MDGGSQLLLALALRPAEHRVVSWNPWLNAMGVRAGTGGCWKERGQRRVDGVYAVTHQVDLPLRGSSLCYPAPHFHRLLIPVFMSGSCGQASGARRGVENDVGVDVEVSSTLNTRFKRRFGKCRASPAHRRRRRSRHCAVKVPPHTGTVE
jgi:hypothetical protein